MTSASVAPAASKAMLTLSIVRTDCSAASAETIAPVASTPFWPPMQIRVAPAGTTPAWLKAGVRTSPSGCRREMLMAVILPAIPDRFGPSCEERDSAARRRAEPRIARREQETPRDEVQHPPRLVEPVRDVGHDLELF